MVAATVTLPVPCLCLVTDRGLCPDASLVDRVEAAVEGGVAMVQLREKDLPGGALLDLARELGRRIDGRAMLIVNERVDVALAAAARGVHLGEAALPVAEARRLASREMLVGRSVHSVEAAVQAEAAGADYLIVGAMFPTRSHPSHRPEGPALLRRVAEAVRVPCLGIGGVTAENVAQVLESGASGAAVVSGILAEEDPRAAARRLAAAMAVAPSPAEV